ncbi:MAG TPA: YCF48-related protein [Terriglobales bacterium]|nr:YCF48-related protein [Terriglobales bacterium]
MSLSVPRFCTASLILLWAGFFMVMVPMRGISHSEEPAFHDNFYDVAVRGDFAWIAGYYGTILASTDRGLTWQLERSETTEALFRVNFVNQKEGWITGSYGTILHTDNSGKSWRRQKSPVEENLFGLDFVNNRVGWVVGSRGTILFTLDGGVTWANRSLDEDVILNDIRFVDARRGWIVGEFGRIYHTRDGGRSWHKQKSPIEVPFISGSSRNLFRLLFANARRGWAFGLDGVILRTVDGENWDVVRSEDTSVTPLKSNHLFAAADLGGKVWAVGERGAVLVSTLGNAWSLADLEAPPRTLNSIAAGTKHFGLIVGNRGIILRTEDGGKQWKRIAIVPGSGGSEVKPPR